MWSISCFWLSNLWFCWYKSCVYFLVASWFLLFVFPCLCIFFLTFLPLIPFCLFLCLSSHLPCSLTHCFFIKETPSKLKFPICLCRSLLITPPVNHRVYSSPAAMCFLFLCSEPQCLFSLFQTFFFPFLILSVFNAPCQPIWPQSSVAVISNSPHYLFIHCHVLCFFYLFNFFLHPLRSNHIQISCFKSAVPKLSVFLCIQIFLDANTIRLGNIPLGSAVDPLEGAPAGTTYTKQTVYELCACANGKLYLSPAEKGSTCQTTSNFCLWSWKWEFDRHLQNLGLKLMLAERLN